MPIPLYDVIQFSTSWITPAQMTEHCQYLTGRGFTGILFNFADPYNPTTPLRQAGVNGVTPLSDTSTSAFILNPTYASYIRGLVDAAGAGGQQVAFQTYGARSGNQAPPEWIGSFADDGVLRAENALNAGRQIRSYFGTAPNISHWIHGWDTTNQRSWEDQIWSLVRIGIEGG